MQDREVEPRFTGAPSGRPGYEGGGGPPRGGFAGGYGGATGGGGGGGGGRQLYVSNVGVLFFFLSSGVIDRCWGQCVDPRVQLPYNVGWQDLKDLFRQAGRCPST